MKDQTNLIVIIVSIVIAIGSVTALYFTKREPVAPPAAPTATLTPVTVANAEAKYVMSLPGSSGGAASFGGGGGGMGAPPAMASAGAPASPGGRPAGKPGFSRGM